MCVPNKPDSCVNSPVYQSKSTNTEISTKIFGLVYFHTVFLKVTKPRIKLT